jgi:hypothetical protein
MATTNQRLAALEADMIVVKQDITSLKPRTSALEAVSHAHETPPGGLVVAAPVGPFTVLDGGGTQESGVFLRNNGGGAIEKTHSKFFTGYGIANMDYWPPREPVGRTLIEDCIAEDITATPPHSLVPPGTAEAGFWFGNPTDARRLVARRASWMGMWTGAKCFGSVIEDFELLEMPHVGLYVEHVTKDTTFRRGRIESQNTGINVEWWYGGAGSYNLMFEDLDIYCPPRTGVVSGMFLDAGTYGCTIRRVRFWGPGDAIGLPNNLAGPTPNVVDEASCVFENAGQRIWYHSNAIG